MNFDDMTPEEIVEIHKKEAYARQAAILRKAANHLVKHGWISGGAFSMSGPCCLVQAVGSVTGPGGLQVQQDGRAVLDAVRQTLGVQHVSVWNDKQCANQEMAVNVLLKTAERLENDAV